jgi:hypothetical protein
MPLSDHVGEWSSFSCSDLQLSPATIGLLMAQHPTNGRFLHRSRSGFSVADNVGSNLSIAGSGSSIAGSVADKSGLNAFQLQLIPVRKWR